jgi:hypothetical protein
MERSSRERRVATVLPVQIRRSGQLVSGTAGNISPHGIYVRTDAPLETGEVVELEICLPGERSLQVRARAVHALVGRDAQELGRHAGIGFRFVDEDEPTLRVIAEIIDEMAFASSSRRRERWLGAHLVVACADDRLLDRITTVLGSEGHTVESASNQLDTYALCLEYTPDLLVTTEADLGRTLQARFAMEKQDVGVLCLAKPFTDEELCIQVATALARRRPAGDEGIHRMTAR